MYGVKPIEFIFREDEHKTKTLVLVPPRKNSNEQEEMLCEIRQSSRESIKDQWYVTRIWPEDLLSYLHFATFPTKEEAALFSFAVVRWTAKAAKENPLPEDVRTYMERRGRELHEEERALLSRFQALRIEQQQLLRFAKEKRIGWLQLETEHSDAQNAVEELIDFKIDHEGEKIQFFSETVLYDLVGKDAARSIIGRVKRVCNMLAPTKTSIL